MKNPLRLLSMLMLAFLIGMGAEAQVLNPTDPVVEYNPDNPPQKPAWGEVGKWVRTKLYNWNTDQYKAYIYKNINFRLMYPRYYNPNQEYPLVVMLHGRGEAGGIYDNEKHLVHGSREQQDAINQGRYDGFALYPQSFGSWAPNEQQQLRELLNYLIDNAYVDPFQITIHGLSNGGKAVWEFMLNNPKLIAGAVPMSATSSRRESVNTIKYTPIWNSQGGLDVNPTPSGSKAFVDAIEEVGGDIRYTLYPELGHSVWRTHYKEPDFFPFLVQANKVNPWPLFERKEFCPGDPIRVTLGLTAGFEAYEWRKNGTVIAGANSNELAVTDVGTYDARVRRDGVWSYWSPSPVEVKVKTPTQTPPVQLAALHSSAIPSPDGRDYTVLELPAGFEAYEWKKVGSSAVIGRESTLKVSTPGEYVATVTEKFGCSSNPSVPFKVASADGANGPTPASSVSAITLSKTEIKVVWTDNPSAPHDETDFEIYRGTAAGGPYELVHVNAANALSYVDADLASGQPYYYVVRAVNLNGASGISNEASAATDSDTNPPTAPLNLTVVSNTTTSVTLDWGLSTDDVGIANYVVYRNGKKSVVTDETTVTVYNLLPNQAYNFTVKAADPAGNLSPASNQATVLTVPNGLAYSYYEGSWRALPDFRTLTPITVGQTPNVSLDVREKDNDIALKFEGTITVPTDGQYTFYTTSDDGSQLYIGGFDPSHRVVDNDGLHGMRERNGTIQLQAGSYPFFVTFFERSQGQGLEVRWAGPGISKQLIPDAAFRAEDELPGNPPAAPSQLVANPASFAQVNLAWSDNSSNETGFQLYRATTPNGTFQPVVLTDANATSYEDKKLSAGTTYYYRVLAVGEYGESGFSNDVSTTTPAAPEAPTVPGSLTATPASASRIALSWQDQSSNETGFEVYRSVGSPDNYLPLAELDARADASATITYADQDLFTGTTYFYKVRALGVAENSAFSDAVSSQTVAGGNHDPVIAPIADAIVKELSTLTINVSASDADGDPVTLSSQNFPAFASLTDQGNGNGTITLNPRASDRGTYTLSVVADDNRGGTSTTTFEVTVDNLQATYTVSVNFHNGGNAAAAPWNNLGSYTAGSSVTNMVNEGNQPSGIDLTLLDGWEGDGGKGVSSGIYPSNVTQSYFYIWQESSRNIKVSGLKNNYQYAFTFFASRADKTDNRSAVYTIGGEAVTLDPLNNSSNTVTIENVTADTNGEVVITISKAPGSRNAYINALVIAGSFDDGNQPPAPSALTATLLGSTTVSLGWEDNSFNETGFEVYRSDDTGANFSRVATVGADVVVYEDSNLTGGVAYQYRVRATNANGTSEYSNVATATTNNQPATPGELAGKTLSQNQVQLSWVDNATNESSYKVYRATSSAGTYTAVGTAGANSTTFTDSGLSPSKVYYYKVSAENSAGESALAGPVALATRSFSVYVNFSIPEEPAPAPWNNTGNEPMVGNSYSNLRNQDGNNTGIDMSVAGNSGGTTFAASGYKGVDTGNDSGIYPDKVLKSYWWIEQVEVATLKFDDLDLAMTYDFVFFGSRTASSRGTDFSINGTTVSLNASYNTTETVEINNVSPNTNGQIVLNMKSMSGAILGYVGAIVVHASPSTGAPHARQYAVGSTKGTTEPAGQVSPEDVFANVSAYPNPFADKVFVGFETDDNSASDYQVSLFDLTGSVVYSNLLPYDERTQRLEIDLAESRLGQGAYVLRITSAQGVNKSIRLLKY